MKASFSIVVCAYNEEDSIKEAFESVKRACEGISRSYEVILVDDGSSDQTGQIMDSLAKKKKQIVVLHNPVNRGFGYSFRRGIQRATKEYFGGFPGDNDMSWRSLRTLLLEAGKADLVASYMSNPQARSFLRRAASQSYVFFMNILFHLKLHYYTGYFVCKTRLVKNLRLESDSIAILGEIKVLLLKKHATLKEIPFEHTPRRHGASKILTIRGVSQALANTISLYKRVYFS